MHLVRARGANTGIVAPSCTCMTCLMCAFATVLDRAAAASFQATSSSFHFMTRVSGRQTVESNSKIRRASVSAETSQQLLASWSMDGRAMDEGAACLKVMLPHSLTHAVVIVPAIGTKLAAALVL